MGGQDATTVLVAATLAPSAWVRQSPVDLRKPLVGLLASARAPPFAIAGLRAHRPGVQVGGPHPLRKARLRLLRLGCTGQGSATQLLPCCAILGPLLQAVRLDR